MRAKANNSALTLSETEENEETPKPYVSQSDIGVSLFFLIQFPPTHPSHPRFTPLGTLFISHRRKRTSADLLQWHSDSNKNTDQENKAPGIDSNDSQLGQSGCPPSVRGRTAHHNLDLITPCRDVNICWPRVVFIIIVNNN